MERERTMPLNNLFTINLGNQFALQPDIRSSFMTVVVLVRRGRRSYKTTFNRREKPLSFAASVDGRNFPKLIQKAFLWFSWARLCHKLLNYYSNFIQMKVKHVICGFRLKAKKTGLKASLHYIERDFPQFFMFFLSLSYFCFHRSFYRFSPKKASPLF